ncbi:MAG TPA: RcnB family protein, partial [Allosphingosinicella sp.]
QEQYQAVVQQQRAQRVDRRDDRRDFRQDRREDRREFRQDRRDDRRDFRQDVRQDRRAWSRDWRRDQRYNWQDYRNYNRNIFRSQPYYAPYRNYSYSRFSIGMILDQLFFGRNYWLSDPGYYRLPQAPYGYQWVRYYDDVLLVDTYTGRVVDVIYDFFW